jgi:hypothetical protein
MWLESPVLIKHPKDNSTLPYHICLCHVDFQNKVNQVSGFTKVETWLTLFIQADEKMQAGFF